MTVTDVHTHHHHRRDAVINLAPGELPEPGFLYSSGVHPWDTLLPDDEIVRRLEEVRRLSRLPEVVAIGEAGIDRLRGASMERQTGIFSRQVDISEEVQKPMILHVVKAFPEIIRLKRELKPSQPWIVHGFRGKPELAAELLRAGFYISLGEHFNQAAAAVIPPDRLFAETDESTLTIGEIAARLPHMPAATL